MLSSTSIPRSWSGALRPRRGGENMHHLQGSSSRSLVEVHTIVNSADSMHALRSVESIVDYYYSDEPEQRQKVPEAYQWQKLSTWSKHTTSLKAHAAARCPPGTPACPRAARLRLGPPWPLTWIDSNPDKEKTDKGWNFDQWSRITNIVTCHGICHTAYNLEVRVTQRVHYTAAFKRLIFGPCMKSPKLWPSRRAACMRYIIIVISRPPESPLDSQLSHSHMRFSRAWNSLSESGTAGPGRARRIRAQLSANCVREGGQGKLEVARFRNRQLRPFHSSDWDRLRLSARRVRTLGSSSTWPLHNVFPSLLFPNRLLRNLRTLDWEQDDVNFHHIHLFLRPTLTRISFQLCSDSESASSLLASLMERCPNLTNILVSSPSSGHLHLRAVSRFVLDLQAVEALSIPGLDQDAVEHLAQLPTLTSLSLESPPRFTPLQTSRPSPNFPALRTLYLISLSITHVVHFFRMCGDVPLEECDITLFNYFTVDELRSFLDSLSGGVSHSSLTKLSVEIDRGLLHDADPALYTILPDTLSLLIGFSNLTYLALSSLLGFDFDDEAVEQLARAWPRMEVLDLSTPMCCDTPRTTPACLQIFGRHCPHLSSLTMAFDGTVIPEVTLTSAAFTPHERLCDLDVQHSSITSALAMTRFLSGSFPNLTGISTNWEFYDGVDVDEFPDQREWVGYWNCWKEVRTVLSELREESASPGPQSHGATKCVMC
ncbi:hypothetical protein C8R47DRAFT_1201747 [Mycena vitilis]|nr:hypothetical protein C8R47DRAFT_1201747 [Mycena vitilis]